jgi:hypothetical protein
VKYFSHTADRARYLLRLVFRYLFSGFVAALSEQRYLNSESSAGRILEMEKRKRNMQKEREREREREGRRVALQFVYIVYGDSEPSYRAKPFYGELRKSGDPRE